MKDPLPRASSDLPRAGEPGGAPCQDCATEDSEFLWANENWRVSAGPRSAVKQVFLNTRAHVDLADMPPVLARELGPMLQRVEVALMAAGDVGRVHIHRWGDGSAHFHIWMYGRPVGDRQMLGFGLVLWAMTLPALSEREWDEAMRAIGSELGRESA